MTQERASSVPGGDPFQSGAFHTGVAHFYRGEMQRLTVWRSRLDNTTQWAIILTTALTTFTLGASGVPHYVMLLGLTLNTIFMVIEGRRYQHLHHTKRRLALLERFYFARLISPETTPEQPSWRQVLASDLRRPHLTVSLFTAARLRLRRNYLMLAYFITAVWLTKLFIHPAGPRSWDELYGRFAVGELLPSWFVVGTAAVFILCATLLGITTPSEEKLEHWVRADLECEEEPCD